MTTARTQKLSVATLIAALFFLAAGTAIAETINPNDFNNRVRITFPGYTGEAALTNFPVLISLQDQANGLAASDFTADDWSELRFTADDGVTALPFEVESWLRSSDATNPTDLAGCQLWLKADSGVLVNATGGVTNWLDQSGNNHHAIATLAAKPTLSPAAVNGKPVVWFDGTRRTLKTEGTYDVQTVIMFLNNSDSPNFSAWEWAFGSTDPRLPTIYGVPGSSNLGSYSTLYVNRAQTLSFAPLPAYKTLTSIGGEIKTSSGWLVGDGDNPWSGGIAEVIAYNRALSNSELDGIYTYLNQKYRSARVWVKVPELAADTSLYAYWGNTNTPTIPAYTTDGSTWNSDYAGVWHLGAMNPLAALQDSTSNNHHGINGASPNNTESAWSFIADGRHFDWNGGQLDYIALPDNAHNFSGMFSIALWAKFDIFNGNKNLIGKDKDSSQFAFVMFANAERKLCFAAKNANQSGIYSTNPVLNIGQWHHLAATVDSSSFVRLYVDGQEVGGGTLGYRNNFGSLRLGRTPDNWWGGLEGLMDEARISRITLSPAWIKASCDSQRSPETFASLEMDALWDTSTDAGLQAGSGTWNTTETIWSETEAGSTPLQSWKSGAFANFKASGSSSITVGAVQAHGIVVDGTGYSFNSGTISLGAKGIKANESITIGSEIRLLLPQPWDTPGTKSITANGVISGDGTLVKTGAGALTLAANNTYTGGTTVREGILRLLNTGGQIGAVRGTLTVEKNAQLDLPVNNALGWGNGTKVNTLNIKGGLVNHTAWEDNGWGITINMTGGELRSNNGVSSINSESRYALGNSSSINTLASPETAVISGRVTLREGNPENLVTFNVADGAAPVDLLVSAAITPQNGGGIVKSGTGMMSLTGANNYTGVTRINSGTLRVDNTSGSGTGSSAVNINGGTLAGTGTVGGNVQFLAPGGSLAPGSPSGTLAVNGNVNFTSAGTATFGVTINNGGEYSALAVSGTVTLADAELNITLNTAESLKNKKLFIIVNNGSEAISGSFKELAEGAAITINEQRFIIHYAADAATGRTSGGNDVLLTTHLPGTLFFIK